MDYATIRYEVSDAVATVTLNRPERLNAWTQQMAVEVRSAIEMAGVDPAVRAIILTGAGRGFCAGADMELLADLQSGTAHGKAAAQTPRASFSARPDFRLPNSYFPSIPKPIIAAINGPCAGLGMVMALYCDMRFAAHSALFTTAFAARGLIAEHGISWLLPRLVGLSNALDLLFSARRVGAEEALRLGLVNRVLSDDELLKGARDYAMMLATTVSPRSVAVMKRQVWEAQFQTLAEAVISADHEMVESFASADFREGVAHFVERRTPRFTGA